MSDERFIIARKIKDYIMTLEDYMVYYPKKYHDLRKRFVDGSYNLLELVYLANYTTDKEDKKYFQIQAIMKIRILDFYLEESYKKKMLSEKQSFRLNVKLGNITTMLTNWIKDINT